MALTECEDCGRQVSSRAVACPECGAPIAEMRSQSPEDLATAIRVGNTKASHNEEASNFFMFQIVLISGISGYMYESWWIFGGAFLGLFILMMIPIINMIAAVTIAGYAGYLVYGWIGASSMSAGVVLGILSFMAIMGANIAGIQWFSDLTDEGSKPKDKTSRGMKDREGR